MGIVAGGEKRLRLVNVCSGTPLTVTISGLPFGVVSQWAGTDAITDAEYTNVNRTSVVLPPAGTATLVFNIHESWAGKQFQILVEDATNPAERRRAAIGTAGTPEGLSPNDPIVSETWVDVGNSANVKLVDRMQIPTNDGIIHRRGFEDSVDFGVSTLEGGLRERVAEVTPCMTGPDCIAMAWGFRLTDLAQQDPTATESSLLFEVLCTRGVPIPNINVTLFGVLPEHLIGDARVPDGVTILSQATGTPLATSLVQCPGDIVESPVQFKGNRLSWFLQRAISQAPTTTSKDELTWLRAEFRYTAPIGFERLRVSTRLGETIPPPTLRLVYRTERYEPRRLDAAVTSSDPSSRAIKFRRLSQVLHELRQEQEVLRKELQTRYDQLRAKQRAMRGGGNDASNLQGLISQVIEQYGAQQQYQRDVEEKLQGLVGSGLPSRYQQQVAAELQEQLRKQYLQQNLLQRQLRTLLQTTVEDPAPSKAMTGSSSFREEKANYLRLYKEYNDVVSQMRHVREGGQALLEPAEAADPMSQIPETQQLVPIDATTDPYGSSRRQHVLARLTIHQGDGINTGSGIYSQFFRGDEQGPGRLADHVRRAGPDNWVDTTDAAGSVPVPTVSLTLGAANEADIRGHIPMWMSGSVSQSAPAEPGSLLMWRISNPTPLTHTLYFHRTLLEVFHLECIRGNTTLQSRGFNNTNLNNGNFIGVTVPTGNAQDEKSGSCVLLAVSRVPKVYGMSQSSSPWIFVHGCRRRWDTHGRYSTPDPN